MVHIKKKNLKEKKEGPQAFGEGWYKEGIAARATRSG